VALIIGFQHLDYYIFSLLYLISSGIHRPVKLNYLIMQIFN